MPRAPTPRQRLLRRAQQQVRFLMQTRERDDKDVGIRGGEAFNRYQRYCRQQRIVCTALEKFTAAELEAWLGLFTRV